MVRIAKAVGSLILLMLFFICTFAIMGMNVFAGSSMVPIDSVDFDGDPQFAKHARVRFILPANLMEGDEQRGSRLQASKTGALTGTMHEAYLSHDLSKAPHNFLVRQYDAEKRYNATIQRGVQLFNINASLSEPKIIGLVPRSNFDSFLEACMTTFQILTLANWDQIWYSCTHSQNYGPFLYFFAVIVIGNYILFNLFAAIIIQGFAEQRELLNQELEEAQKLQKSLEENNPYFQRSRSIESSDPPNSSRELSSSMQEVRAGPVWKMVAGIFCCVWCFVRGPKVTPGDDNLASEKAVNLQRPGSASAFGRLSSGGSQKTSENWFIHTAILFAAVADNVILAIFQGLLVTDDVVLETNIIKYSSTICLALSALGLIARCRSMHGEVITDTWNLVDIVIMLLTVPEVIFLWSGLLDEMQSLFLFFRACRPVRVILCSEGLRDFGRQLRACLEPLINTFFIVFFSFVILGILGVNQLSGQMFFCSEPLITSQEDCLGFNSEGQPLEWKTRQLNFDWIGSGVVTMFVVATKDRWTELMYHAVDSTQSREEGAVHGASPAYIVMYFATVFIGGFFLLNIFAGVVVDTHKQYSNVRSQKRRAEKRLENLSSGTDENNPTSFLRARVCRIVRGVEFDIFMLFMILMDIISMSCTSYKSARAADRFASVANYVFSSIYSAEAMAKLYAYYPRSYIASSWNRFEFGLVLLSVWSILLENFDIALMQGDSFIRVLRIFRAFRVLRAFRLLNNKAMKSMQELLTSLSSAASQVIEVFGSLFIVYLIFGNLMAGFFGHMCDKTDPADVNAVSTSSTTALMHERIPRCSLVEDGDLLDGFAVSSVARAMVALLAINTADSWSRAMRYLSLSAGTRGEDAITIARGHLQDFLDTRDQTYLLEARMALPGCQSADELRQLEDVLDCRHKYGAQCMGTCGNKALATVLCALFFCITSLVILNVLLAVLMQSLQEHQEKIKEKKKKEEESRKSGSDGMSNVQVLMNVSRAAAEWQRALQNMGDDSDSDDDYKGPVLAGLSPMALANLYQQSPGSVSPHGKGESEVDGTNVVQRRLGVDTSAPRDAQANDSSTRLKVQASAD